MSQTEADVAQLVEQPIRNRQVSGSSPLVGSRFYADSKHIDYLEPVFYPTILSHVSLTCRFLFTQTCVLLLSPFLRACWENRGVIEFD